MPEPLTPIERKIYQYLIDHLKEQTFQPSIREIGRKFGIRSTKTVAEHLESLERKGHIVRVPSRSRGVRILGLNLSPHTYTVRLYDRVDGAGRTPDEPDARLELDRSLVGSPDAFFVRIERAEGDVPGVLAGDYVLVEPVEGYEDGQWLALRWDGRVRLARWRASVGRPCHPGDGRPVPDGAVVLGRMRALVRRFDMPSA